jgi:hypothetical protein
MTGLTAVCDGRMLVGLWHKSLKMEVIWVDRLRLLLYT